MAKMATIHTIWLLVYTTIWVYYNVVLRKGGAEPSQPHPDW